MDAEAGEWEESFHHAADDYEVAIELDGINPEIYQKLAEVYIALEQFSEIAIERRKW